MQMTTLERAVRRTGRLLAAACVVALLIAGCAPKLEEGDLLEKTGDTFTIRLTKKIDEPIERVWQGFQTPERLEKYSEQYQQTKLVKDEGNTKVVDYRVSTLGQVQAFTMELTLQPSDKVVKFKTLDSTLADIVGEYILTSTDGGKATFVTYKATQKDKVNIPAPVNVQKTAIKEAFDNLVAGIDKGIKSGDMGAAPKTS
ncbi:MAG: SRPBCC family protein [Deltaproteobacteria bacterium]|nr:SRPBCC family protein [Deltaproteobacteria bacterium]